jgi:hypothetical protein
MSFAACWNGTRVLIWPLLSMASGSARPTMPLCRSPRCPARCWRVIAQGSKRLALGKRFYDYGVGQYLIASADLPVSGHFTGTAPGRPALGFGMTLEPAAIAELLPPRDE